MFTTNYNVFQMEQMASLEDADLTNGEQVDLELFSDNLNETFQTRKQNMRRKSRHLYRNLHSRREEQTVSAASTDNSENSSNIPTLTHEQSETNISDSEEHNRSRSGHRSLHSEGEEQNVSAISTDDDRENSSNIQIISPEHSEINIIADSVSQLDRFQSIQTNIHSQGEEHNVSAISADDELIYEVPEDDYFYLNERSTEDGPFHTVNWNLDNESTSKEESSIDNCTVCLVEERTHAFVPCGHLACCSSCIERLEANRCPICNVIYEDCIRIIKP
ncbi:uncharacterized protein [Temnothorax longispinosus]|uniref:uncharacterized protein n=1 Tax=Temnothorax longispinosus TaxID=300112 RepID=UPI003A996951